MWLTCVAVLTYRMGMTHDEFCEYLRKLCETHGTQASWAKKNGLSSAYVSDVIGKRREPGQKICAAAGVIREAIYRKAK